MRTITLRHLPKPLEIILERRAKKENMSLNRTAIRIMEESVGLTKRPRKIHHDLDRFFGSWPKEEGEAFDAALRDQRKIDPEAWR